MNEDLAHTIKAKIARALDRAKHKITDPLEEIAITGDVEADSAAEVSTTLASFKNKNAAESDRHKLATDSEYWFAVCFQSREQKEYFLKKVGWLLAGDKYLDGSFVAMKLGVELPKVEITFPGEKRHTRLCESVPCITGEKKGGE